MRLVGLSMLWQPKSSVQKQISSWALGNVQMRYCHIGVCKKYEDQSDLEITNLRERERERVFHQTCEKRWRLIVERTAITLWKYKLTVKR